MSSLVVVWYASTRASIAAAAVLVVRIASNHPLPDGAKRRPGPGGRAISEANYAVSTIGEALILAVPVSGAALVWSSAGAWSFSDLWIWASLALFVVAFAISRGVLMPGHRRINRLLAELDEDPTADSGPRLAEIDSIGKTSAGAGGALNVLLVVIVVLMIWKPGG